MRAEGRSPGGPSALAHEADHPPVPVQPLDALTIYTALQFRTARSARMTETSQQKELRAPVPGLAPALRAPRTKPRLFHTRKEEEFEILDLEAAHKNRFA